MAGVKWAFTNVHAGYWIPLTWISLMFDYSLNGLFAGGYHLTNIILHTLNALLLFLLLKRMTRALWPSALVAALFAWHPLHLESVAWVTERKDVLSTFFRAVTILAYLHSAEKPAAGRLTLSLIFFLGLMAKPMLVTLPFLLLLLDFWPLKRLPPAASASDRTQVQNACLKVLAEKIPFLVISFAAGVATVVTQHIAGGVVSLAELPFSLRMANGIVSYASLFVGNDLSGQPLRVLSIAAPNPGADSDCFNAGARWHQLPGFPPGSAIALVDHRLVMVPDRPFAG